MAKLSVFRCAMLAACLGIIAAPVAHGQADKKKKPSINVKANPPAGFSPLRVVISAELRGGADDYQEFYCPSIEWAAGDKSLSVEDMRNFAESSVDCEPYEPGRSSIRRRYTVSHVFHTYGNYKVEFRLKQGKDIVGFGSTTVQVRPGIRDGGMVRSLIPDH